MTHRGKAALLSVKAPYAKIIQGKKESKIVKREIEIGLKKKSIIKI
ncbi:hypothetical protein [Methanoplanus limicola]|uniref:Uncharacterized protein n=1 Tax=Methanoplanus limicola DSM 2279 TaxID=937775 RepID=H1YZT6_9EURY|nr:hypothetical protein [Methanoplanus limicola]EHQ34348.1 hypothetical protein Metlim_0195 [Methanoplanus limicola DSM 2279]